MKYLPKTNQSKKTSLSIRAFSLVGSSLLLAFICSNANIGRASAAGNAIFSMAPSASSVTVNTDVSVAISEDSGSENINAVSVKMTYNAAQLSYKSINLTGSAFSGCLTATGNDATGIVDLVCYMAPPNNLTGKKLAATVIFTAKASTGTATLSFVNESASNSRIAQSGTGTNIWNGNTTGTSLTLKAVVVNPPTGGGGGGGGGGTTTNPPAGGTTTPTTTPTTTTPSTTKPTTTPSTNVTTSPASELIPVAAPNATGKSVSVYVSDANSKAVAGAKVTLGSKTYLTDATGVASFGDVKPGSYNVKIVSTNGTASKSFTVTPVSQDGTAQKVEVVLKKSNNYIMLGAIALGAVFVLAGAVMVFKRWQMSRMMSIPSGAASEVVVNKPPEAIAFDPKPVTPPAEPAAPAPAPETPKPAPAPAAEKEPEIDIDEAAALLKKAHVTESVDASVDDSSIAEPRKPEKPVPVVSAETSPTDAPKPTAKVDPVVVTPAEPKA